MPERLPQLKPRELLRALEKLGFVFSRQTGSHAIFRHPETKHIAVVPIHARDIKRGLLFGILKRANISTEDLQNVLH